MFAHPVVNLLGIPVEELQVHALLILLPADLPQIQERLLLLRKDAQLQTTQQTIKMLTWSMGYLLIKIEIVQSGCCPTFSLTSSEA